MIIITDYNNNYHNDYDNYLMIMIHYHKVYSKYLKKDITLTRNRVIRICIQNTPVPPIAGYF